MKPFDLEAALEGEPVQLRNGRKAHVLADKRDLPESWGRDLHCMPLVVIDSKGNVSCRLETGYYSHHRRSEKDIIGMWETENCKENSNEAI